MTIPNKFQQFIDLGMMDQLLPIIPATGVISPDSSLKQSDAGKQPGIYNAYTGQWTGFPGWSLHNTTFDDINLWSTWPGDNVGILTRLHPGFDIDIDDNPTLVKKITNVMDTFVPGTGIRIRANSSRVTYYLKLADGEHVQGKCKIILKDDLGAVELLWGGQQSVLCGTHVSGNLQTFTGVPLVVTAEQISIIWEQLIAVLGDLVQEVTKAGDYTLNNNGGNIDYVATDSETIEQVRQYIATKPGAGEGERDDTAFKHAAYIRQYFGVPAETCYQELILWADRCDPPFPHTELMTKVNSAYSGNAQAAQGSGNVNGVFAPPGELPAHISAVSLTQPPAKQKKAPAIPIPASPTGIYTYSEKIGTIHWHQGQINTRLIPDSTIDNFKIMLAAYEITIIYDVVAKSVIIKGPGINYNSDISDNAALGQIVALCKLNRIDTGIIMDYLSIIMSKNERNPVEEWINSKPWDGMDRIDELFNTLTLAPEQNRDIAYMMFRKWLIGTVRIVQRKINHFESVLVLQEDLGGIGKTAWFKQLCPEPWRKDGVRLNPDDKDSVKQAIGYWLVELGELDSIFRKSDIKNLMAFLSNSHDEIRLPYGKTYNKYARRTAFFATVNKREFLIDDSGDRRFWPIAIAGINYEHDIDMQQLWAQVDTLLEPHWLNQAENVLITDSNKDFKSLDPIEEILINYFHGTRLENVQIDSQGNQIFDETGRPIMVPAPEVHYNCTEILNIAGIQFPTKAQLNKAGTWLRKQYKAVKKSGKAGYYIPAMVGRL